MLTASKNGRTDKNYGPALLTFSALVAAIVLTTILSGLGTAQAQTETANTSTNASSRVELRDKQLDVSLEARDIERILGKLKRASDLSKQRITDAAQKAESASGAIERGDSSAARAEAKEAAAIFKEIAKQLEALLAEETPQRVAAAQNLAQELSMAERQFMRQFPGTLNPTATNGKGKIDPRSQNRPQANRNEPQDGSGAQPNQPKGKGGETKEPKDKNKADEPKETKDGAGNADDKKDVPTDGKGKNGKIPEGEKQDKQKGKGEAEDKTKEGAGSGKKKEMPPDGAGGGGEKEKDDGKPPQEGFGGLTEEEQREAMARRAEELAETGKTLEDILKAITQSTDPADAEAVRMVEAVLKETNLTQAIATMQEAASTIRADKLEDARIASLDIADRMEIAAQRLGTAYRLIVAPKAEELRDIEKALAKLREQLEQLETASQIAAWHREARDLLDKLDELGMSEEIRDQFLEEMKKAGFDVNGLGGPIAWQLRDGRYIAPESYAKTLLVLQEDLQQRLQSLVLGDLDSSPDEATPPKYQELVERYYQVLSRDSERDSSKPKPSNAGEKK